MGVDIEMVFYTKEKITKKFVKNVLTTAERLEGECYKEQLSVSTKKVLNEAYNKILKKGYNIFGFFLPAKNSQNTVDNEYGGIGVRIYIGVERGYTVVTLRASTRNLMKAAEDEDLFFSLIRNIAKAINPVLGYGASDIAIGELVDENGNYLEDKVILECLKKIKAPVYTKRGEKEIITYIPWILFFGDRYLKKFSKKDLLKTPAMIVEETGKGVLIISDYMYEHKELGKNQKTYPNARNYLEKIIIAGEKEKKIQ